MWLLANIRNGKLILINVIQMIACVVLNRMKLSLKLFVYGLAFFFGFIQTCGYHLNDLGCACACDSDRMLPTTYFFNGTK